MNQTKIPLLCTDAYLEQRTEESERIINQIIAENPGADHLVISATQLHMDEREAGLLLHLAARYRDRGWLGSGMYGGGNISELSLRKSECRVMAGEDKPDLNLKVPAYEQHMEGGYVPAAFKVNPVAPTCWWW